jgi:hypothetical protein
LELVGQVSGRDAPQDLPVTFTEPRVSGPPPASSLFEEVNFGHCVNCARWVRANGSRAVDLHAAAREGRRSIPAKSPRGTE